MERIFYIQPWINATDFYLCYDLLFEPSSQISQSQNSNIIDSFINSLSIQNLIKAKHKLIVWESRNDNKTFVLSTLLLLDILIKIKEGTYSGNMINMQHMLGEVLIRVTNLVIDELKKTKKTSNQNMYQIGKEIGLPQYIIDLRHACTHKNLPNYNSLVFAIKYFFVWTKENMWDKQKEILNKENDLYQNIKNALQENEGLEFELDTTNKGNVEIKLEIEHLMSIIEEMFIKIYQNCKYNKSNKKVVITNKNVIDGLDELYGDIERIEGEFLVIFGFHFIIEQLTNIYKAKESSDSLIEINDKIAVLVYYANFIVKNSKSIPDKLCEIYESYLDVLRYKLQKVMEFIPKHKDILEIKKMFDSMFGDNSKYPIENDDSYYEEHSLLNKLCDIPMEDNIEINENQNENNNCSDKENHNDNEINIYETNNFLNQSEYFNTLII